MEVPIISDEINKSDISSRKKLRNRLTTGVFALLIALIAVVSATYAWYIYNTSRHTTKVRMAAGAGVNLQISNSYSGTYGSAAVLDSFSGRLNPVSTNRISGGFQKVLGFTNGTENQSNLVASLFGKGDYSDYYNTSLFLKTNGDPTDIYIADIGFEDSDSKNPISSAIRVGFVVHKVGKKQPSQGEYIFAISDKKNPQAEYNTAKGKEGVSNITYNGQFGISHAYKQLQMLSPDEWRHVNQTLFSGVGKDLGASTNWMDWVQNSVYTQNNHTVSLTQATKKGSMRATFGINDRTGSVRNTGNTTYYGRFNSNLHGLNNKLSLEFNLSAIYRESKPGSNVWSSAAVYNPTYPSERNPETGIWDIDNNVSSMVVHPGEIMEYDLKNESTRINASARATYKIIDGLSLSAFGSFMYVNANNKAYYPNDVYAYRGNRGRAQVSNRHGKDWMGNIQANYSKEFNKHAINALALVEGQSYYTFNSSVYTEGFDTNYFKYNNLAAGALLSYGNASSGAQKNTLLSYMARLNYMFDNKYVITVNARTDGSSKLGANHKWGFFPSASAAWIISNEEFMKKQKIFSTLKLRAGYGVTGNQDAISPLNSLQVLSPNGISSYNNQSVVTYAVASNANPDLKWETKYTFDIGLDFTMFNGRLRGTMDYFHSTTKDLLYTYNVSVPPFTYPTLLANMGEMVNKGFEFSISGEVIKNKKWGLNLSGNVSFLKNKLISLSGAYNGEALTTTDWVVVSSAGGSGLTANTAVTYMAEGYPVGIFRLPVHDGFNQASDGKKTYKFKDLDGDGTIDHSDSGDREILGQVVPKVNMNLNAQLRYKQFDLSVQFNGAFGHKIYNATHLNYNNLNLFPSYNVLKTAPDLGIYDIVHTSYWLEKGDYVNIEYITLGYNIPTKVFKVFSNARIALSCNNVATITGYSGLTPMINSASFQGGVDSRNIYPINRTYTIQLILSF